MKTKIDRQELSALPVMGEVFYRGIDPKKISAYTAGIKGKKFTSEQAIMVWPKTETAEKVYCVRRIS